MEENSREWFTRCIICSDISIQKQCYNIFHTTLEDGKVLLSDFVKNVLDCTVLIVVSPEFFVCKRCFSLCRDLDCSLTRCNKLQLEIRGLFRKSKQKELGSKNIEDTPHDEDLINEESEDLINGESEDLINGETEDRSLFEETIQGNYVEEVPSANGEDPDPYFFLHTELVESEVTVDGACTLETEESCETERLETIKEESVLEENRPEETSSDTFVCQSCDLPFESEELLTVHKESGQCIKATTLGIKSVYEFQHFSVKLRKRKKVYFCNRCAYETYSSANIQKHLKTHRTEPEYMCDACGRRFKYLKTFERHKLVHDESRPFACKLCSFRAMTEFQLKIHEKQHDDQKKFSCTKCGYKTLKKMSYIIHCRKHTGERPYCCPNCPYKAKDPSTLLRHRRIHGGIKRYQCTICDYKAVQKASLKVHMMTHTGEKPFACEQCDYRSSAKHNLQAHVAAIHSNEKPFACTQCDYRTKIKRLLTYHLRRHSDEKPFACSYCDYRVRYKAALRYHVKKKHPIDENGHVQTIYLLNTCQSKRLFFRADDLYFSDEESGNEAQ